MAGCPIDFADGVTLKDPQVIGGEFTKPHLINPSVEGALNLDDNALNALVTQLEELIKEIAAGALKDCQGLPLVPDFKIATCSNLADAIAASCCGSGGGGTGGDGDTITGVTFNSSTRQLAIAVTYPDGTTADRTWTVDIPAGGTTSAGGDAVTAMAFDTTTRKLKLSVTFPDGSAAARDWEVTIPGGGEAGASGDTVTAMTFDTDTRKLSLSVTFPDGSTTDRVWEVAIPGGDTPVLEKGGPPFVITTTVIPIKSFGGDNDAQTRDYFMAEPDMWAKVYFGDVEYSIPLYKTAPPIDG